MPYFLVYPSQKGLWVGDAYSPHRWETEQAEEATCLHSRSRRKYSSSYAALSPSYASLSMAFPKLTYLLQSGFFFGVHWRDWSRWSLKCLPATYFLLSFFLFVAFLKIPVIGGDHCRNLKQIESWPTRLRERKICFFLKSLEKIKECKSDGFKEQCFIFFSQTISFQWKFWD